MKTKDTGDGVSTVDKYKARIVYRGDLQQYGEDFDATWAPVAKFSSIRMLLAWAGTHGYRVRQLDFVAAFLNGELDEEIYMEQPEGYAHMHMDEHGQPMVCKLNKSLYGLKQAGRVWYRTLCKWLFSHNFIALKSDSCVFIQSNGGEFVVFVVYVDDVLMFGNSHNMQEAVLRSLHADFDVEDKGDVQYYVGINVQMKDGRVHMDQRKMIHDNLEKFGLEDANPCVTPISTSHYKHHMDTDGQQPLDPTDHKVYRSMVGALVYIAVGTRPDIAYAVSLVSSALHAPCMADMWAVKRVWKYLKHSADRCLTYSNKDSTLRISTDSNYAGCLKTGRSHTGYVTCMFGGPISWKSCRQPTVALSTSEAEWMAVCAGAQEMLYLWQMTEETGLLALKQQLPIQLYADNKGALHMAHEGSDSTRTRHMSVRYHFVKDLVTEGKLTPIYVHSSDNAADGLTKALPRPAHERSTNRLLGQESQLQPGGTPMNLLLEAQLLSINPHCM